MIEFWVYVPGVNGADGSIAPMKGFASHDEAQKFLDAIPVRKAEIIAQIQAIQDTLAKLYAELDTL